MRSSSSPSTWRFRTDCCSSRMDILDGLLQGFQVALTASNLTMCVIGVVLGTIIGVLPGLGPPATIAMLLPLTFKLDPTGAMIMLAGIYYGAKYGGGAPSLPLHLAGEYPPAVAGIRRHPHVAHGRRRAPHAIV